MAHLSVEDIPCEHRMDNICGIHVHIVEYMCVIHILSVLCSLGRHRDCSLQMSPQSIVYYIYEHSFSLRTNLFGCRYCKGNCITYTVHKFQAQSNLSIGIALDADMALSVSFAMNVHVHPPFREYMQQLG